MKKALYLITVLLVATLTKAVAQDAIFPKGELAPNVYHTGDVWLNHLADADKTFDFNVVFATFGPGAKLNWHLHPKGQQLYITKGVGFYQERDKEVQVVRTGDIVKCLPDVEHWHAAAPNSDFAYWAITMNEPTKWTDGLTDEVYNRIETPALNRADTEEKILALSKQKWQWMADKDATKLADLFHKEAQFVHMGGSWGTERELDIIKSGGIHYKKTDVHEASVDVIGDTAILLNKITLLAVVRDNEVTNPFMVTEVYKK